MKRILFFLASLLVVASDVLGQGRINFSNTSGTAIRIGSNPDGSGSVILGTASTAAYGIGPASVRVTLYAGLTSSTMSPVSVGTCACLPYVTNTSSTIASAQGTFAGGNNLPIPGSDGVTPYFMKVTATSLNGLYFGESPIIQVVPVLLPAAATPVFNSTASSSNWNGILIGPPPLAPWIVAHPQSQTVNLGASFTLNFVVNGGSPPRTYQWRHFGTNIPNATNSSYTVASATLADGGSYSAVFSNSLSQPLASSNATITVVSPVQFTLQPLSQIAPLHGTATFDALADGLPAPTYQWSFNGSPIPGATSASLTLTNIGTNALGNYQVVASNPYSAVTSAVAALYMSPSLQNPFSGVVGVWGKDATLSVFAQGSGALFYQWFKDGVLLAGATNASLVFPSVQFTNGGLYHVVVTSAFGSVTNVPAQLVVNPAEVELGFYAGLLISGVTGQTYGIQYSTNLSDTNGWISITNLTLTQPVELWIDTSVESRGPGNNGRYYRVSGQ
jgi:hypothetical protein